MQDNAVNWTPSDFLTQVVTPALVAVGLYSDARAQLVLATALTESGLRATVQRGGGPALGFFQMEPFTHNDLFSRFLGNTKREPILAGLRGLSPVAGFSAALIESPQYAAAMCAVKYFSIRAPLPVLDDREGMAAYWKKYYNSPAGAGTVDGFLQRAAAAFPFSSLNQNKGV